MPYTLSVEDLVSKNSNGLKSPDDLHDLIEAVKDKKVVMLGESSHGTQEFYEWRRLISEILIEKHGFNFIAVEGDWPACYEVHRYLQGKNQASSSQQVLQNFSRWPTWMWNNTEVEKLVLSLKDLNAKLNDRKKPVGFFGLDVYSLYDSMDRVQQQLRKVNPELAEYIKELYACFDPYEKDVRRYLRSLYNLPDGCREEVMEALQLTVQQRYGKPGSEELFDAEQNARIVRNAENYYQAMMSFNDDSWNVRDQHMIETLQNLLNHYGPDAKALVWAHNTHIGDYRATTMLQSGLINIGGQAREIWGAKQVALVGFGTFEGQVTASHAWDGPTETMEVPRATKGSYEEIFHQVALMKNSPAFFLDLSEPDVSELLKERKGHRAIGVVYDPGHERGNYVPTLLSKRYDHFIFIDQTRALTPLIEKVKKEELPETWPGGF